MIRYVVFFLQFLIVLSLETIGGIRKWVCSHLDIFYTDDNFLYFWCAISFYFVWYDKLDKFQNLRISLIESGLFLRIKRNDCLFLHWYSGNFFSMTIFQQKTLENFRNIILLSSPQVVHLLLCVFICNIFPGFSFNFSSVSLSNICISFPQILKFIDYFSMSNYSHYQSSLWELVSGPGY